ncbi:MAG: prepilin-type N-terminal cleavage/methylation domain-containing protein [Candidatus Gracilibacteria bacterium]|nr:prepilin-type N-terminal cleavage/methylation domain-containing protein [Candidatus Gracilibacteria bacterium]
MNIGKKAFTLIEIMIGILIVTIIILSGFEAYVRVGIGKINLIEKTNIQKDSFYFTEKIFQLIKEGGTIDYEEYFNRKVLGTNFFGGHYSNPSGFGNFGSNYTALNPYGNGYYYCRSGIGLINKLGNTGCYSNSLNTNGVSMIGSQQRYGQYSFQFIDYNSDFNNDFGDEDGDGNIIGDDDDENLGVGPLPFISGSDVKELYLISGDKKTRTFLRWNVITDPDKISTATCAISSTNVITGDGCRGTIEFLKLKGVDRGMDHISGNSDITENDGVIDTWLIDPQFTGGIDEVATTTSTNYWKPLLPTSINVVDFKVYPFPNIENKYYWKISSLSNNISPYVVINMSIKPSWEIRKKLKNNPSVINFNMTVNLTDIFSK